MKMGILHSNPRMVVQLAFSVAGQGHHLLHTCSMGKNVQQDSIHKPQQPSGAVHFAKDVYLLEPVVNLFDLNSLKDPPSLLNVQPYSLTEMERKPKL
jgi:hypothetical protein